LVKEHYPQGVQQENMTLDGFLYLNLLFIQKGRIETTWTILRKFGYGNDLSLREDFLRPSFHVPHDCTVEMSNEGYQFFIDLFQSFDKVKNMY
jgi:Ras family protein T1